MPFTIERWRHELRNVIDDIARNPSDALAQSGAPTLYPLLLGCTMLPIAAAYDESPNGVMSALVSLAGGFGVNLIANLMQGKYTPSGTLLIATYEAQSLELGPAYEKIALGLNVLQLAEAALLQREQRGLYAALLAELGRHEAALHARPARRFCAALDKKPGGIYHSPVMKQLSCNNYTLRRRTRRPAREGSGGG